MNVWHRSRTRQARQTGVVCHYTGSKNKKMGEQEKTKAFVCDVRCSLLKRYGGKALSTENKGAM